MIDAWGGLKPSVMPLDPLGGPEEYEAAENETKMNEKKPPQTVKKLQKSMESVQPVCPGCTDRLGGVDWSDPGG